ncbi:MULTISPECIES: DUF4442 domain-containing protein [unclassified Chitinophaga]|uniref:DUF4442 domain-containing protein n=1 Tax=unclassified Chitinophaga TaxID=2619133 RepID=UPI0009C57CA9|nr:MULTISPECIES: DUF4442 domain-containing protein [unclassified Chitinophaga]OMP75023.1 hypothetical protein BW716_32320 [[Flexibacter] sp. ATCC 35208]WPV69334.1 DUF4442 domain-containing protein [Chitinophaga sp. LS1]
MIKFQRLVTQPWKFSLFLLYKLPAAWLAGVRVQQLTPAVCITSVPFRWLSQNPFKSTYFACLAMAAEMSTGLPAMWFTADAAPARVSMLVTGMQASFLKKATGKTYFTCEELDGMQVAIQHAVASGEPVAITVNTTGRSHDGTVIATFAITWSFKKR